LASYSSTVRNLVVCLCGLVGFAMLSVFPSYRALSAVDKEIADLRKEIEAQKVLYPLFQNLQAFAQREPPSQLPYPKPERLSREEAGNVSMLLQRLARESEFTVVRIMPDMVSFSGESDYLKINAVLRGDFANIRPLLIRLGELPYFAYLQTLELRTAEDEKEVHLRLWLMRENS